VPRTPPASDLERAIEVLNTWDTLEPEPEVITDADMLRRFLRWAGRPELIDAVRDADVPRFRALRERLRAAFEARSEAEAVAALNAILADHPAVSELAGEPGSWQFRHRAAAAGDPVAALAPEAAIALLIAIRDAGWSRLGICSAAPCSCVYVDGSRNHSRRYCSDQCNDRMSQSAHRRRRREPPAPPVP